MDNVDQLKNRARGLIVDQIDSRSTELGNAVGNHAHNLRSMSGALRDQGQSATANLIDSAAERLGGVSTYLTQTDGDRIVHDLEEFARKQAVVTAAVGLVGGFLAARLLRASATQRYRTYGGYTAGGNASAPDSRYDSAREDYAEGYDDLSFR
ncbi:MAG: hypothetical protein M3N13_07740 [Candidatus Eremiobacteraeota bacterium]|nr:hypothetical protein [Candidatus Eremiobacteraeota bacterium]